MFFAKSATLAVAVSSIALGTGAFAMQSETPAPAQEAPAPDAPGAAAANPVVGGAEMLPTRNIVENASASQDHTTLVSAVQAAGLAETLSGTGPFTVFAPDNEAFGRLAPGTLDTLLKAENKPTLERILKYHVVPGDLSLTALIEQGKASGGTATLTTLEGTTLSLAEENGAVKLTDANGNVAYVSQPDVKQSNGVVHVINGVVIPKLD